MTFSITFYKTQTLFFVLLLHKNGTKHDDINMEFVLSLMSIVQCQLHSPSDKR